MSSSASWKPRECLAWALWVPNKIDILRKWMGDRNSRGRTDVKEVMHWLELWKDWWSCCSVWCVSWIDCYLFDGKCHRLYRYLKSFHHCQRNCFCGTFVNATGTFVCRWNFCSPSQWFHQDVRLVEGPHYRQPGCLLSRMHGQLWGDISSSLVRVLKRLNSVRCVLYLGKTGSLRPQDHPKPVIRNWWIELRGR